MTVDYQKIINFMISSGKRIAPKSGSIADIGVAKIGLTEEDLAIERGFNEIIKTFGDDHVLYAEEENDLFKNSNNLWVVDPISGTQGFIEGRPNSYSIVISHLVNQKTVFGAVYNPARDELFTAYEGRGAFLNKEPIKVGSGQSKVILRPSREWDSLGTTVKFKNSLNGYEVETAWNSIALQYCQVACGRTDGMITATKDTFPEFAGAFIIQSAGGKFTNIKGAGNIDHTDRVFVAGNPNIYDNLFEITKKTLEI